MRVTILTVVGILLLSSSVILSYHSPDQSFTLKVVITLERHASTQIAIKNVTYELLNAYVPEEETVYPFGYEQGVINGSRYIERLTLELQGQSLPYHVRWVSFDLVIQSGGKLIHFFQNVEPGEYLLKIQVYGGYPETQAQLPLIGEDTRTLRI